MNVWMCAAAVLMLALLPCFAASMRGGAARRLVGLEALGVIESLLFLTLARALGQSIFYDLAVAIALLAFGGALVFARFVERWL